MTKKTSKKTKKVPVDVEAVRKEVEGFIGYMGSFNKLCLSDMLKIRNLVRRTRDLEKIL